MNAPEKVYRFYDFEFSTRRHELRKAGHRVRMPGSQIRLLTLFLERRGELVTREEIVGLLWADTATIDVASGLNTAINRLRVNLGDDSVSPRFLETVIGLGYRFIAPVEEVKAEVQAEVQAGSETDKPETDVPESETVPPEARVPETLPRRSSASWLLWGAIAVLLVAGAASWLHFRHRPGTLIQTAAQNADDFISVTSNRGGKLITAASLSPDGKFLAYADPAGIRLQTLATHQETALPTVPASEVSHISWLPNEDTLVVSGQDVSTKHKTVWLVPLAGMGISQMATNADLATVSPDSNTIAFTRSEGAEIWLVDQNQVHLRKLVTAEEESVFSFILWSPDSRRIMLVSHRADSDASGADANTHWTWSSVDASTGKLLAHEDVIRMDSAVMLPNGRLEYVTGVSQDIPLARGKLWSVQTDPATGRFLGAPVNDNAVRAGSFASISASRDGSVIAVLTGVTTADVFTASLHRDHPDSMPTLVDVHRLTSNVSDTYPHAWASDGTIIYEADYEKRLAIYGQKSEEAAPLLLAHLPVPAVMAQLSPDGRWILFLGLEANSANVYRVPASGGTPEEVAAASGVDEVRCARTGPLACVMRKTEKKDNVQERLYFALDPLGGVGKLLARTPFEPARRGDWGLSPDGSTVVVASHDPLHPALNFLKLNGSTSYEKTLPLPGHGAPLGVNWTPDSKALFVETRNDSSLELLYVDLKGHAQVLRQSSSVIWAIPSPNGDQIAFPGYTTNTQVWVSHSQP